MRNKWIGSITVAGLVSASAAGVAAAEPPQNQPNVLFFALDDMNDWVGAMGYKQAITPNMDRLAKSGVIFQNAHSSAIFCAPSRSAVFTGRHASITGCYTTQVYFQTHPEINPLHKVFFDAGYETYGAGKLFHHPAGYIDPRGWTEFFLRTPEQRKNAWDIRTWSVDDPIIPQPYPNSIYNQGITPANKFFLEWGKIKNENEAKMADTIRTEWACDLLRKKHDQPVFVGVGLYATHFPNYVPEKYFDLYDADNIELPPYKADDLDDLPPAVQKFYHQRGKIQKRLESFDAVDDAVLGYLAAISYEDAMLGRLMQAIESGPNAGNTIIVLWSDQGYHHGEKFHWGKHTLWNRTTHVPLIWAGPGITKGASIDATVSLLDMFPTLTELCGVPDDQPRDGTSLVPVLKNPASATDRDVMCCGLKPEEYTIINDQWRYIHYADGTEELYNEKQDPNEWDNLASNPELEGIKEQLRASAPARFVGPGPEKSELKLQIHGDTYAWESLRKPPPKVLPGSIPGAQMVLRDNSDEATMSALTVQGRPAWTSEIRGDGQPTYFYFKMPIVSFCNGKQPNIQVSITYLDKGNTPVAVEYDSSDKTANAGGTFKMATSFQVGNSGKWKTEVFNLNDAQFSARANGGDLRLAYFTPDAPPVIAEIMVKPLP